MKKQRKIMMLVILILVALLVGIIYVYIQPVEVNSNNSINEEASDETVTQVEVSKQTIRKTLAGAGQISSALTEKIPLHATYYLEVCNVEENEYIAAGENILQYTNGTYLTAPYNCVISSISIPEEKGQCTSKHYIEVIATDTLQMELSIEETDIDLVSIGQEVEVKIDAKENSSYIGYVSYISEIATYSSNGSKFKAIVTFSNDGTIKIGMSSSCEVILAKAENVIAVPTEAIETVGNIKYVEVVNKEGSTTKVQVKTGIENDAYVEITEGVQEGDIVQITESKNSSAGGMNANWQERKEMFGGEERQSGRGMMQEGQMPPEQMK